MDNRRSLAHNRNLILSALFTIAVVGSACAASPRGTAPVTGSGGASATGGATGRGGQAGVSTGGSSSGGNRTGGSSGTSASGGVTGTEVDSAAGGSTGTGGSQGDAAVGTGGVWVPQPLTCKADVDCPSGRNCKGGACVNPPACHDSLECGSTDLVCDPGRGLCVQCVRAADCPAGQSCLSNRCSGAARCGAGNDGGAGDCGPGKVCDPSGRCVQCSTNADCGAAERCVQNVCRAACDSDKDCTPKGMLCSLTQGMCSQCSDDRPCAAGSYCDGGTCKFVVCVAGESRCVGNGIASCKADGSTFGTVNACPASRTCKVYGGVAECEEVSASVDAAVSADDGGASAADGGNVPVSGGPRSCGNSAPATPCVSLPNLLVTQTLDGKGDEFCDVPAFHLNAETAKVAGKVIVHNAQPPEDATIKVAWSPAGLALFIEVADVSVQSAQSIDKVYQGDSIELFLASSNDVKGFPGADSNALHVTIPADGQAVLVKTTSTGITHTKWETSTTQYKQLKTATGYTVEAQLPWPASAPATGSLVRFDIGLNSADKNFGGVDDMRDGQLIYYVGQVGSSTCQASDGTVPFCDDRTWCTTILQ